MPTHRTTRVAALAVAAALATTVGCGPDRTAAEPAPASPSSTTTTASPARAVPVDVHWENPPDGFALTLPCTDTSYIPTTGLCHGTGSGAATLTGAWQGTAVYTYGFATTPENLTYFTVLETFTGTVTGCGTGAMSYRLAGTVDPAGVIADEWEIVDGFGEGDLAGVTGHGQQLGTYNDDFSQSGDFSGELTCAGSAS